MKEKNTKDKSVLRAFFACYKPYLKTLIPLLFAALLATGASLLVPLCIRYITDGGAQTAESLRNTGFFMLALVAVGIALNAVVEFCDVRFSYETTGTVLEHVSLRVQPGEYMAVVGRSGAGKTTLCALISRLYDADSGAVRIDGRDVRDYTLRSLRSQIGVVEQATYLFAGTVAENIAFGTPGATREQLIEAAKRANAHEFIEALPNGYDTYVGERGVRLSGGQRQRISIARVFLKDPPILVFDEATSALDAESELAVRRALDALAESRTTFVIAHRLSTVRHADRTIVISEKGIAQTGTHESLMQTDGVYRDLYALQMEE